MAATNISVNKQTVLELLTSGQKVPFLIPEYQRPYSWSDDEIITLFDDLWDFSKDRVQPNGAKSYFLGCVVTYEENGYRQVIDGQQRITSLFLLLRGIFAKLENVETTTSEVANFINKIKPALWKEDEMTGTEDRSKMLLKSDVISDSGNEILRKILEDGKADLGATDNYSKNYNKFVELYTEKSKDNPLLVYQFILSLLNYTILLPIEADDQETALTIFNTLNDRGLPLSDADIFKSYIYKTLDDAGKVSFIQKWKQLDIDAHNDKESIQSLFYYNMFYLRAKEKDVKSTTPGVRKYYLEKGKNRLNADVIDDLAENLLLWEVVNNRKAVESEAWSQNMDIRKILDCLSSYTNEFWKYPVSIFYMKYKNREDFDSLFLKFLRKFYVMLATKYLEQPTISAVKSDILKLNAEIISTPHPIFFAGFEEKKLDDDLAIRAENTRTDNLLIMPNKRMERMLLKLLAYEVEEQTTLLPSYWEIEHIFPKKWDSKYFDLDEEDANVTLEHLGNKLPLEEKLNISASNNYFDKKKEKYKESKIAISLELGNSSLPNWTLNNIRDRDSLVCDIIKGTFKRWIDDYEPTATTNTDTASSGETPEEMIKKVEQMGYKVTKL